MDLNFIHPPNFVVVVIINLFIDDFELFLSFCAIDDCFVHY